MKAAADEAPDADKNWFSNPIHGRRKWALGKLNVQAQ
jgi:hypothetical protein